MSAIRVGFRYARNNRHLRATLFRSIGFFLFASAYWALLPLVARLQLSGELSFTAYCWAQSAPVQSAARLFCRS